MTLKKSLTVFRTAYVRWFFSSRLLIFAFAYMFFYVYFIKPMVQLSEAFNTPLNALEPFTALMNNGYFLPLTALTYLILISDQPRLDDSAAFILFRTGRIPWLLGQLWFLMGSALTFIGFLLISSMLTVMDRSFVLNAWSLVTKSLSRPENRELAARYPFALIDRSVIFQSRPYEAVRHGILLMLMFMVAVGTLMMMFSLKQKKIFGVFANLSFIAAGLVLWAVDNRVKWLFPISNTAFGWHYDRMYDKTVMSISYSYIYFTVLCLTLITAAAFIGKRCSFHITGGTE